MTSLWLYIALALTLGLSFFLNGMEAGVQALSRLRIRQWLREGRSGARSLLEYLDRPENFLWTILVGNTLTSFAAIVLIIAKLQSNLSEHPLLFLSALLVVWGLVFVFADLLPKTLFRLFPNRLCLNLVWLFKLIHLVLSPIVRLVERFAALLLKLTQGQAQSGRLFGNRDELRALLHESGAALQPGERALINRVLDAQNIPVGRVATPLADIPRLTTATPLIDFFKLAREKSWDRLPVWEADTKKNSRGPRVQGVVTLHRTLYEPQDTSRPCGEFLSPTVFLDETLRVDDALRRLQRGGSQMGIVLGANGQERGFVTIEQLLQTFVGEVSG